jgi:hypothetical protein
MSGRLQERHPEVHTLVEYSTADPWAGVPQCVSCRFLGVLKDPSIR